MRRWPTAPALILGYRTRVSPTGRSYGPGAVQAERQVATSFPVRSTHPVYVNPARADEAFLTLPEAHMLAILVGAGAILVARAATLVLPVNTALPEDMVFMAFVGVVLSVLVVFLGVALVKAPRPCRRR